MCLTTSGLLELTRLSVIDENHECLLDMLVKPDNEIVDYLTQFSGITEETLSNVTTTLRDAQKALRKILPPDAILCGHSLCSDLHALKLYHPYVIDTSVIFNLSGSYYNKTSLKNLTSYFLGQEIQSEYRVGHCSIEDSKATMQLVQLKIENGLEFGDCAATNLKPSANIAPSACFAKSVSSEGLITKCYQDDKRTFYKHSSSGKLYESLFGISEECGKSSALVRYLNSLSILIDVIIYFFQF